ncbi:MAG: hypothetical protein M1834_002176 [Cirrosporium novae-zelandiae]|nr:MAG: hypothetical protein M1834_002176 [Cirrosporium novae-zelandiae]
MEQKPRLEVEGQRKQCMDDTRNVTKDSQANVDEEITVATTLEEYTKRREDDGKDDLANVAMQILARLR